MNSKFKMQSSKLQFKIQNLIIWELIGNCLPAKVMTKEGKLKIGNSSQDGYIAISIVLILTAVLLGIMVTVAQLGIGEGQVSLALSKGEDSLNLVEGCTEDALLQIRSNSSLSGTFTIGRPPGEGTCLVTVVSKLVNTWTVDVTTQAMTYKRTIRVVFDKLSTGITLTSWKEI